MGAHLWAQVVFVDALSEALGVRPFPPVELDTSVIKSPASRAEIYQYVVGHGAAPPGATGDKVGDPFLVHSDEGCCEATASPLVPLPCTHAANVATLWRLRSLQSARPPCPRPLRCKRRKAGAWPLPRDVFTSKQTQGQPTCRALVERAQSPRVP